MFNAPYGPDNIFDGYLLIENQLIKPEIMLKLFYVDER